MNDDIVWRQKYRLDSMLCWVGSFGRDTLRFKQMEFIVESALNPIKTVSNSTDLSLVFTWNDMFL